MRGRGMHGGWDKEQEGQTPSGKAEGSGSKEKEGSSTSKSDGGSATEKNQAQSPLDILKERLARGEIDIPDFEARKRLIVAD